MQGISVIYLSLSCTIARASKPLRALSEVRLSSYSRTVYNATMLKTLSSTAKIGERSLQGHRTDKAKALNTRLFKVHKVLQLGYRC